MSELRQKVGRIAVILFALLLIAGCANSATGSGRSDSSSPRKAGPTKAAASTSTVPDISNSPDAPSTIGFLHHLGAPIATFERETSILNQVTNGAQCRDLEKQLLPILKGGGLFALIDQIRNPVLNFQLTRDVNNKLEYLSKCSAGTRPSSSDITTSSSAVRRLLEELGIQE